MPAQRILIEARDGARSEAVLYAEREGRTPLYLLLTPAMGVPARYYEPLAQDLSMHGLPVLVAELRGVGSSSLRARRGVDFGYLEMLTLDLPAALAVARARFPGARAILGGHSLGGHISALSAGLDTRDVAGLLLMASGTSYFRRWSFPENLGLLAAAQFVRIVSALLGYFPGYHFGFGGTEAKRFMFEWATLTSRGCFRVSGSTEDFERRLAAVELPILAFSFEGDRFAPKAAVDHLLAKMPHARSIHRHLSASDLGTERIDHFRWAKHPRALCELVARWASQSIGERQAA